MLNARVLLCLGALAGAAANAAVLVAPGTSTVIALRFLTGAALACVYPPGMKIAAGWFRDRRGFALGILIGALTLGKAFPHLLTALYGDAWREPMLLASGLAVAGGVLVLVVVRDGPFVAATAPFDPQAIRRIFARSAARGWRRSAISDTCGSSTRCGRGSACWRRPASPPPGSAAPRAAGSLAAFLAIGSGTAGCALAGWLADRLGRARVAIWAMSTSAACAAPTVPLLFGGPPLLVFALVMVWGFAVVADSAQFSALVSEHSPRDHVGTALTLQTCLGFLLTIATIEWLPRLADQVGWRWASLLLVPGPLLGVVAMRRLT